METGSNKNVQVAIEQVLDSFDPLDKADFNLTGRKHIDEKN